MSTTERQKELFESMHDRYYGATTDAASERYKEEFIYDWIEAQLGNAGSLIELASGTGSASGWLRGRRPGLDISGCDISEAAASEYSAIHSAPCHVWDLTKAIDAPRKYDVALVLGGLHHLISDLPTAFENILRILNPGGRLIMMEPNADFILEPLRRFWYALDRSNFDAANERALSHHQLFSGYGGSFELSDLRYVGGPGYFLILQNWVLRLPGSVKHKMAPSLMQFERLYHKIPGAFAHAAFLASWKKKD